VRLVAPTVLTLIVAAASLGADDDVARRAEGAAARAEAAADRSEAAAARTEAAVERLERTIEQFERQAGERRRSTPTPPPR
jgi:hypothetical protein